MKIIGKFEKVVMGIIAVLLLILMLLVPVAIKQCSQVADEVTGRGLKHIVNDVWEGKGNGQNR